MRLLMASGNLATVDAAASPDLSARVAQVLQPYFAQDQFPGISVAVVTDGQVALAQGYGLSNAATGSRVQADTRFDIGSVTKTFTALGVLLLYQESQGTSHSLDLNAPISDYLHDNKSFKLPQKWSQVTTMELLDMTSGIRDVGGPRPWQSELRSIAKDPLLYAPGTESSYSDANYDLLGELIEQRTGESYGSFIKDQILRPLGMSETQELGRSATVPNQAVGYKAPRHLKWRKDKVQNGPAMYASAGMVSTAQDMATYMTALLSGRILDPATYELMWTSTPTLQYGVSPPSDAEFGLGWDTAIDTSRAHRGRQERTGPRIQIRAHPLPLLGQRSLRLLQLQLSRQARSQRRQPLGGGRVGVRGDPDRAFCGRVTSQGEAKTGQEPILTRRS